VLNVNIKKRYMSNYKISELIKQLIKHRGLRTCSKQ